MKIVIAILLLFLNIALGEVDYFIYGDLIQSGRLKYENSGEYSSVSGYSDSYAQARLLSSGALGIIYNRKYEISLNQNKFKAEISDPDNDFEYLKYNSTFLGLRYYLLEKIFLGYGRGHFHLELDGSGIDSFKLNGLHNNYEIGYFIRLKENHSGLQVSFRERFLEDNNTSISSVVLTLVLSFKEIAKATK